MRDFPLLTSEEVRVLCEVDPDCAQEYLRRCEAGGYAERPFVEALHGKQLELFRDLAKIKAACCSRRAGKSEVACAWLQDGAERVPGGLSIYVMLTRNNCRLTPWNTFQRLKERHRLGLDFREVDGQLQVILPNEHRIWLAGCKNQGEVGKFRGGSGSKAGGYTRVVVDEAQNYGPFITELIDDALLPGLMDQSGELLLTGTPGPVPAGYFYDVCTNGAENGIGVHHWTWRDNPYLKDPETWMANFMRLKRWTEDNPTYQREYLGLWVRDEGALVYPYNPQLNAHTGDLGLGKWRYAMGVDLGYEDATAFVIGAYQAGQPEIHYLHAEKHYHLIPSKVAAITQRLQQAWNVHRTVVDTGGFGKGYFEEMQQTYGLAVEPAKKENKRAYQELLAGDLKSGTVKVNPYACRDLVEEWQVLQWDKKTNLEDESFDNHCSDAALYLHRTLRASYSPVVDDGKRERSEEFRKAVARAKARSLKERRRLVIRN